MPTAKAGLLIWAGFLHGGSVEVRRFDHGSATR